jgi:uncharacterized protein (DUF849 family)
VQKKLIIEARINEYMMRESGAPNVPYSPQEIADDATACAEAGAAIVHFHARQPDGKPDHSALSYRETVRLIRERSSILVNPTLGYVTKDAPATERLSHILEMAKTPSQAPHIVPIDMGSVNVDRFDAVKKSFESNDLVYKNSTGTLTYFVEQIRAINMKPYMACWSVGFTRFVGALLDMGLVSEPAFLAFVLTDNAILGGHPGNMEGLRAHLDFLPVNRQIEWTAMNFGGNLFGLLSVIIARGGHVSIGLGDYPYNELGQPTNAELIREVARISRSIGREVASPDDARAILGIG